MPSKLKKLSNPQMDVVDTIAHIFVASEMSRNVKGMEKFEEEFLEKGLTPKQKQIWNTLNSHIQGVRRDMVNALAKECSDA